jgi:hypothetical protein
MVPSTAHAAMTLEKQSDVKKKNIAPVLRP